MRIDEVFENCFEICALSSSGVAKLDSKQVLCCLVQGTLNATHCPLDFIDFESPDRIGVSKGIQDEISVTNSSWHRTYVTFSTCSVMRRQGHRPEIRPEIRFHQRTVTNYHQQHRDDNPRLFKAAMAPPRFSIDDSSESDCDTAVSTLRHP